MDLATLGANLRDVLAGQAATLAILSAGVGTAALLWRAWPFYRRALLGHATAQPTDGRSRYDALDGLRGILCLLVVVHHAAVTMRLDGAATSAAWGAALDATPAAMLPGHLAVGLFFAVTGFLFYARAIERPGGPVAAFWVGRLARIGPALWTSLALVAIATSTRPHEPVARELALRALSAGAFSAMPSSRLIVANAGVLWTLPYEWGFYAAFPILAWMTARGWPVWARAIACVAAVVVADGRSLVGRPTPMFLGGIAAVHLMTVPAVRRLATRASASLTVLAVLALLPAIADRIGGPWGVGATLLVGVTITLIVAGCNGFGLLRLPALRAVGIASYSVYLMHGVAFYLAGPWLHALADRPAVAWSAASAIAAVIIALAMASYRWIEHTGIALGRRLTRGARA